MPSIHVYEPALCCNTGVCGPDPTQELVAFTADLRHLSARGADIARHNLANDPVAFADSETVRSFLRLAGAEGLPLVLVDGVTVLTGRYPSRSDLLRWAGLEPEQSAAGATTEGAPAAGCCGSSPTPASGECCGSSPTPASGQCCGSSGRPPEEPCCSGSSRPGPAASCCGGSDQTKSAQTCCDGSASTEAAATCCGSPGPTETQE